MTTSYTQLERYYNIVYDQEFSPSGKYLATCDTFGRLAVFSLSSALSHSAPADGKTPLKLRQAHNGPMYSLTSAGSLLVSAGVDNVKLWRWEELTSPSKNPQLVHTLTPPPGKFGATETNSLVYNKERDILYAGCGNNSIYGWDLSTNTLKESFSGHSNYVHCVCLRSRGQLLSGSEDGTVKMWDPSSAKNPVRTWKPAKGSAQWVGCVTVDGEGGGEWMVCGGSMAPTIYHLASNSKIATLPVPPNVATQAAIFAKDRIITAGSESTVRHWAVNGEPLAAVPGGHQHSFSLAFNTHRSKQYEVLTVTGDSSSVNVFTEFGYKAFSLSVT